MLSRDLAARFGIKPGQVETIIRKHSNETCQVYAQEGGCGLVEISDDFVLSLYKSQEYLESIKPEHDFVVKQADSSVPLIQNKPVVYWLIRNGVIVYIGQSRNLLSRIGAHCQDKDFDSLSVTTDFLGLSFMDYEGLMIMEFKPMYNSSIWDNVEYFKKIVSYS